MFQKWFSSLIGLILISSFGVSTCFTETVTFVTSFTTVRKTCLKNLRRTDTGILKLASRCLNNDPNNEEDFLTANEETYTVDEDGQPENLIRTKLYRLTRTPTGFVLRVTTSN